jgi:hypothetical protein
MEVGGNRLMKSNGCKSRAAKASEQAGSECCHSPGDWGVRSVHSKEAGREESAPKSHIFAMPTPFARRKAASGTTAIARAARDRRSPKLRACFQRDFPQTQESSPSPLDKGGKTDAKGDRRRPRTDGRAVLRPRSTSEGGEPQGFRKERPRHPLEGRGKQGDVSVEGNISETQNSRNYVHKNRQNI